MSAAATARTDAARAAARAGVTIRPFAITELDAADELLRGIWGTSVMEAPLMVALDHAGAYVCGAFDAHDGALAGVCIGYFSQPLGTALHSHVAGVAPGRANAGIGIALKLDQRAWALERGLSRITWTFDPLVSRNAAFNLRRLGVDIAEYLVDFYGEMSDGVNAGQGSDRMLASWPLDAPVPDRDGSAGLDSTDASALLTAADGGEPHLRVPDPAAPLLSVAIPPDIEAMRTADPVLAARWRGSVRGALAPLLAPAASPPRWRIAGFHDHRYLLERL